jgi:hypothetical protein
MHATFSDCSILRHTYISHVQTDHTTQSAHKMAFQMPASRCMTSSLSTRTIRWIHFIFYEYHVWKFIVYFSYVLQLVLCLFEYLVLWLYCHAFWPWGHGMSATWIYCVKSFSDSPLLWACHLNYGGYMLFYMVQTVRLWACISSN